MSESDLHIYAVGTLSWDSLRMFSEYLPDRKVSSRWTEQLGGVGFNALYAALHMAYIEDVEAEGTLCTKLGADQPDNVFKTIVKNRVEALGNINILDIAANDMSFKTPNFPVMIDGQGKRFIPMPSVYEKTDFTSLSFDTQEVLSPENTDSIAAIHTSAEEADAIILTSRMPEESLAAAKTGHDSGIPVVLDLNFDDPSFREHPALPEIIQCADYIFTPAETIMPGMQEENRTQLLDTLIETYGKRYIVVSDGARPVTIYAHGTIHHYQPQTITTENGDVLGCGDTRTGAAAFKVAQGAEFLEAAIYGSAVSSFSANYFGRSWSNPDYRDSLVRLLENLSL